MWCFESEVGPRMLQASVQVIYNLQFIHRIRTETTHNQLHMVCGVGILAALVCIERWTGALQARSRSQPPRLRNNFIFGTLY